MSRARAPELPHLPRRCRLLYVSRSRYRDFADGQDVAVYLIAIGGDYQPDRVARMAFDIDGMLEFAGGWIGVRSTLCGAPALAFNARSIGQVERIEWQIAARFGPRRGMLVS